MILAAGRGQRLRPLTDHVPKPLTEVGGRPLLFHQLEWLTAAGIREVVINVHHLGEQIVTAAGDGRRFGLHIHYSREARLLETGGGVVNALPLLGQDPFVLVNGDIYTDFPLSDLPAAPPTPGGAHLLLTPRPAFRAHGDFAFEDGRIRGRGEPFVFCGVAVLDPGVMAGRRAEPFSLLEIYDALIERGALTGQIWRGYWNDIGSLEQLRAVNAHLRNLS